MEKFSHKTKTMICFGDSNTWGYDPRSYLGGQYPEDVRWTGLLEADTGWSIINCGQNGREIPHDRVRVQSAVDIMLSSVPESTGYFDKGVIEETGHFDKGGADNEKNVIICIMLGSNDLLMNSGFKAENVAKRMEQFLNALLDDKRMKELQGHIRIMLVAPPIMKAGTWVDSERLITESVRLGECYGELAHKLGIEFKDMTKLDIPVTFDGVHLSAEGHKLFADEIKKCLQ